jgi:hypothetical protein
MISKYNKFLKEKQMRDILNLLDSILTEAAGGMSKRWLDSQQSPIYFLDAEGNRYTIDNLVLFPLEQPVLPVAELGVEVEDTITQMGLTRQNITFVNRMPAKQGAGMLIIMKNQKGKLFPFFKFFPRREMDTLGMHYSPADFERETGLAWQQTRVTGTGKDRKEEVISRVELKPKQAVPTNTNLAISSVPELSYNKLASDFKVGPELAQKLQTLLTNTLNGSTEPVPGLVPYERDIRVDFGEVAAPLGLVAGAHVGGSYSKVQNELLGPLGVSWGSANQVFYPDAGNEPLYDSQIMWPNGEKLRISNKAEGKGGAASTTSILEIIDKYPERFSDKDKALLEPGGKYGDFITALRTIAGSKGYEGPVKLAQEFKYIDSADAENALKNLADKTNDINLLTPKLQEIVNDKTIFDAKTHLPDYKVCYNAIASLARLVVKHLNADIGLTTEFFKFMLSRANLIQVNQFTERKDDGVAFSRFDVIWPPNFTGKIKFSASDFQSNKKATSRLAFSVGNERATKTKDADTQTQEPNTGIADPEKLDRVTQKRSGVTARAGGVAPEKLGSEKTLGRKRQR